MKKLNLLLLSALMLIACDKSNMKINGTVENGNLNGKKVYIVNSAGTAVDSAVVENGKFRIKNIVGKPDLALLVIGDMASDEVAGGQIVLEEGVIEALVLQNGKVAVSGTPLNDKFAQFNSESKKIDAEYEEIQTKYADAPQVVKDSLERDLDQKYITLGYKYAKENADNLMGKIAFYASYWGMSIDQKAELIASFSEELKQDERIAKIASTIEQERKSSVGQPFIDFSAQTIAGDSLKLSSMVGKTEYVLVDFWASWCGPCIKSLPSLKALYSKYKGKKLEILGVSLDSKKEDWAGAVKQYDLAWKHVSDLNQWSSKFAAMYAVQAIPATILIDKNGMIVGRNLHANEIEDIIK